LIQSDVAEGATLVTADRDGPPTSIAAITCVPKMRIARKEIFGPVLSIMPYDTVEEAIERANDTVYGLASYIQAKDIEKARQASRRMRSGNVYINYPVWDPGLPFGCYKQYGNGRENAEYGLDDFLEIKGIAGYAAA
jgi:aldehyde dehydrogenase (NAD+)